MTDLMDRLDEMGQRARDRAAVPTIDEVIARKARRHHSRRRTSLLAVAAAIVAVAIVGGVLVAESRHHTRVTTSDQQHGAGPHLAPTVWPAELNGSTTAFTAHPWDPKPLPVWVLAHDGKATAMASIEGHPMQPPPVPNEPPLVEKPIIHGSTGWDLGGWAWTDGDDERVEVAIHPGWTLGLSSGVTDRATLKRLAAAFDPASDRFSTQHLPAGWSIEPDPLGLDPVIFGASRAETGWDVAERLNMGGSDQLSLSVSSHRADDAAAIVASIRELNGQAGWSTLIDVGRGGMLHAEADGVWSAVWAPSHDVIAVAWATSVGRDDLLTSLRSVRPVSAEAWTRMQPGAPRIVDGFSLGSDEQVIGTGTIDRWRWMVATEPAQVPRIAGFPESAYPKLVTKIHVRSADGSQHDVGGGTMSAGAQAFGRDDQVVLLQFGSAPGLHDAHITYDGRSVPTVAIPIPELGVTMVFGLLPARETPTLDQAKATVTGRLTDGSPLVPPTPSGG
jgi:hypothetical protein